MAKAFSLASWNVEQGEPARIERVVAFLGERNPDVLALYEVEGKTVFEDLVTRAFVLGGGRLREREGPQSGPVALPLAKSAKQARYRNGARRQSWPPRGRLPVINTRMTRWDFRSASFALPVLGLSESPAPPSTRRAALSGMRRVPPLGQKPRCLQWKAAN